MGATARPSTPTTMHTDLSPAPASRRDRGQRAPQRIEVAEANRPTQNQQISVQLLAEMSRTSLVTSCHVSQNLAKPPFTVQRNVCPLEPKPKRQIGNQEWGSQRTHVKSTHADVYRPLWPEIQNSRLSCQRVKFSRDSESDPLLPLAY